MCADWTLMHIVCAHTLSAFLHHTTHTVICVVAHGIVPLSEPFLVSVLHLTIKPHKPNDTEPGLHMSQPIGARCWVPQRLKSLLNQTLGLPLLSVVLQLMCTYVHVFTVGRCGPSHQ